MILCFFLVTIALFLSIFIFDSNLKSQIINIVNKYSYQDTFERKESIFKGEIGTLNIEKIGLNATVMEGSDKKTLNKYIGHIESTSLYDGNVGLAAHNRGNKYSYFARINELEYGDVITYETKFFSRNYIVNNIQVIDDKDWSLLQNTEENKLTLITCIANKGDKRLCVQAILNDKNKEEFNDKNI